MFRLFQRRHKGDTNLTKKREIFQLHAAFQHTQTKLKIASLATRSISLGAKEYSRRLET